MESEQLLDLLGNQNRRKILQLLASRPCYMSEIAERLDVGAKAILGHLGLLEEAGLVEAHVDERRRKYFHINDNLRLEVCVSPYSYEVETTTIAMTHTPDYDKAEKNSAVADLKSLYLQVQEYLVHRQQVLQEYQKVQTHITEAMGQYMDAIEEVADDQVEAELLYALLKGPMSQRSLAMRLEVPEYVLEKYLERMKIRDLINEENNTYRIS